LTRDKKGPSKPLIKWKRGVQVFASCPPTDSGVDEAKAFVKDNLLTKEDVRIFKDERGVFVETLKDVPYAPHELWGAG
jgi:hypothetical protein